MLLLKTAGVWLLIFSIVPAIVFFSTRSWSMTWRAAKAYAACLGILVAGAFMMGMAGFLV